MADFDPLKDVVEMSLNDALRTPQKHADELHKTCGRKDHRGRDYLCRECVRFFMRKYGQHNNALLVLLSKERERHAELEKLLRGRIMELEKGV